MLLNKTFAPEFCSLISNRFDMREQAPGANLLHESVSEASSLVCTEICLPRRDVAYFFIHNPWRTPIGLFHHSAPSSCPSCVLVGVLTRERVSGASSLVCTGLKDRRALYLVYRKEHVFWPRIRKQAPGEDGKSSTSEQARSWLGLCKPSVV